MIYVIATIEIADGQRAAFLEHLLANIPHVQAEEGCIEYGAAVDIETEIAAQPPARPNTVVVVEKWDSRDALEAHLIAPHMLEYRKRVKDLVANVSLQVLEPAQA